MYLAITLSPLEAPVVGFGEFLQSGGIPTGALLSDDSSTILTNDAGSQVLTKGTEL